MCVCVCVCVFVCVCGRARLSFSALFEAKVTGRQSPLETPQAPSNKRGSFPIYARVAGTKVIN